MPTNVTVEYIQAEKKYHIAKTREQKIFALEEMISTCPKHKGSEVLLAELKSKLAKLKKSSPKKTGKRTTSIQKEGDAQVCILGLTQSGKSTLLSKLTNAKPKISHAPYTTTKPEIGTIDYGGAKIQLIEIPSTFEAIHMSIAQNCDAIIIIYADESQLMYMEDILKTFRINKPAIRIYKNEKTDTVKDNLWNILKLTRIYCKEPGKPAEKKPLVLRENSTVADAASKLHKDFYKFFKFARVWGKSAKYAGQTVGKDHRLKDGDTLEIHI